MFLEDDAQRLPTYFPALALYFLALGFALDLDFASAFVLDAALDVIWALDFILALHFAALDVIWALALDFASTFVFSDA